MKIMSALVATLQIFFSIVALIIGIELAIKMIFPRSNFLKRFWRFLFRYALRESVKKSFRAVKRLVLLIFTTHPEYRLQQIYLENYPLTPIRFYQSLTETFTGRQVIGTEISGITRYEWHLLSARRTYLSIKFRHAVCLISGVPLGTSFLISWRYTTMPNRFWRILFQIPLFGVVIEKLLAPQTFYRTDLYLAFEQLIRSSILETSNLVTQEGIRPLTEIEQRPLLREFYGN